MIRYEVEIGSHNRKLSYFMYRCIRWLVRWGVLYKARWSELER